MNEFNFRTNIIFECLYFIWMEKSWRGSGTHQICREEEVFLYMTFQNQNIDSGWHIRHENTIQRQYVGYDENLRKKLDQM